MTVDYDFVSLSVKTRLIMLPQILACGSSDGAISVLSYGANNQWEAEKINNAHTIGCNSVSWAPALGGGVKRSPHSHLI